MGRKIVRDGDRVFQGARSCKVLKAIERALVFTELSGKPKKGFDQSKDTTLHILIGSFWLLCWK